MHYIISDGVLVCVCLRERGDANAKQTNHKNNVQNTGHGTFFYIFFFSSKFSCTKFMYLLGMP